MFNESELDAAVEAGKLAPDAAHELRQFVAKRRSDPPDAERDRHFRYNTGASGLASAAVLLPLLIGTAAASLIILGPIGAIVPMAGAWLLSIRFAPRREGVATTLLYLGFAIGTAMLLLALQGAVLQVSPQQGLLVAGGCALASFVYWRRFRLPISFAGGVMALLTIGDHLLRAMFADAGASLLAMWGLASALIAFAIAMWWDMTDVYRQTIRSDIGFWMHGLAAIQLWAASTHLLFEAPSPISWSLLHAPPELAPSAPLIALAVFAGGAMAGLAADRRAVIVIGIIHLARVVQAMFEPFFLLMLPFALVLAGSLGVLLTLHWGRLRRSALRNLPLALRAQLPRCDPEVPLERPVR